jgi:two-component sensor histidine kinase
METAQQEKLSTFHAWNAGVWVAYGLISFAGALPYIGLVPHLNSVRSVFVSRAVFTLAGVVCSSLLRAFLQRQQRRLASLLESALWALPLSYLAGLSSAVLANTARQASGGQANSGWESLLGGTVSAFAVYLCWCASYFAFQNYRDMQGERENTLRAEAAANEAKWMALRGKVNPHFLFNSLNSIQALIEESPARAHSAIGHLASLLRHSLSQSTAAVVPLSEEIDLIQKYLAMEKIRFEENLIVDLNVQPSAELWSIPGLLLHPLVENALKYGMQTSRLPLRVQICASTRDGNLRLEVANTGHWLQADREYYLEENTGIGLRLVREHLEHNYRGRYQMTCVAENGWVVQRIAIAGLKKELQDALSCLVG